MKNKEIEELLNKAKDIAKYGADGKQHTRMFNQFEAKALLSYIEQLENKIKNLKNQVNTINNNNEELKRRLKIVQQKRDTHKAVRYRLENNRDKAIEEIDNLLVYNEFSDTTKGFGNVPEQLKFYLSDYDTLDEFRKKY